MTREKKISGEEKASTSRIETLSKQIQKYIRRTPLSSPWVVRKRFGREIYLKEECLQVTGAFKARSAVSKLLSLSTEEKENGVVVPTVGNGGLGVCYATLRLGIKKVKVVLAESADINTQRCLESYGSHVSVERFGKSWDEAAGKAMEIANEEGLSFVHPFDDNHAIEGAGTIGVEIVQDLPNVEMIVVQIGGGSLIAGILLSVKESNPKVRIIGVEPVGAPSMLESVRRGHPVTLENINSVAHGLSVKRAGEKTFPIVKRLCDDIVLVSDEEIVKTSTFIMDECKLVVEPSGAAGMAAVAAGKIDALPERTVVILSGGNINWKEACSGLQKNERIKW